MIDGGERLSIDSPPHHDPPATDLRQIEGVERLTALEHHVVGDVDDVVHARDPDRRQPVDEPVRTRPHSHAANHPRDVAGADLGGVDLHGDGSGGVPTGLERPRVGHVERPAKQHGRLAGHPDMPEEAFIHRISVANELDRLVSKKIHSAHEKKSDVA